VERVVLVLVEVERQVMSRNELLFHGPWLWVLTQQTVASPNCCKSSGAVKATA
jgi:hypothetical protein